MKLAAVVDLRHRHLEEGELGDITTENPSDARLQQVGSKCEDRKFHQRL